MTREEEIKKYAPEVLAAGRPLLTTFIDGMKFREEHPKNPWRDVKKELPKVGQEVIGILDTGEIFDMRMTDEGIWFTDILAIDCPQYWMPIPELPKGE